MNLETIRKRLEQIDKFETEIKACREMLKSELENDPAYMEAVEEAKTATTKRNQIKNQIMAKDANDKLLNEIKENQEEVVTIKEILSAELFQVYQEENLEEIEDNHGTPRLIQINAKLVPKKPDQGRNNRGQYVPPVEAGE